MLMRDGAGGLVEGETAQRYAAIADRADDELSRQSLAFTGVAGDGATVLVGDEFVVAEHDRLDPLPTGDLHR